MKAQTEKIGASKRETDSLTFQQVRNRTDEICKQIEPEDAAAQPMQDVSPPKWHLAHTSWFFENFVLKPGLEGYREFHPSYNFLFNSYYNSQGDRVQRDRRGGQTRPTLREVMSYREYVDRHMVRYLESRRMSEKEERTLNVGLNHEQQHQELLITDIKYILSQNHLDTGFFSESLIQPIQKEQSLLSIDEGLVEIGASGAEFCFDNECPVHSVYQSAAQVYSRPVLNREYLKFIEDGGYDDPLLWLSDGWAWRQENNVRHPLYWNWADDQWEEYSCAGRICWRGNAPVAHLSYYEAEAYAQWAGARLCTEVERELLDDLLQGEQQLWEWTSSPYTPYPGFEPWAGALGEYNGKFMVNQMVLRGGSVATSPGHYRSSYRNFFHPDKQWQFTGLRLAKKITK